jgi:alanine-glyoxylate transaminase/serine-glyoxylate transaminase/serine-pyruvate transaminase
VFERHNRAAEAVRRAVRHWGFEIQCRNPAEYSSSLTAVILPQGHSADGLRAEILKRFDVSLGSGLGPLADKVFRIGHLGDFNDPSITGTLSSIEMGLRVTGVPHRAGGMNAAMDFLAGNGAPITEAAE